LAASDEAQVYIWFGLGHTRRMSLRTSRRFLDCSCPRPRPRGPGWERLV